MAKRMSDDMNSSGKCGMVYVQRNEDENLLTISFEYKSSDNSKRFNLRRVTTDPLASSLERIRLNIDKINKPPKKSKILEHESHGKSSIKVELTLNGKPLNPSETSNENAWVEGAVLDIDGQPYEIRTNDPQVESLHLPTYIMKGYIVMPVVNLVNCEISDCRFFWFRQVLSKERDNMIKEGRALDQDFEMFFDKKLGYKLHEGFIYTPSDEDFAHHLRVVCQPCRGERTGLDYHYVSNNPVELGPENCPFEKRQSMTSTKLTHPGAFRCVTYNILANLYADSDYSRKELFAHCPTYALEIGYRRNLLLKEMLGYNADLICLQEVDKKEYLRSYEPSLRLVGDYSGVYHAKGDTGEGLATFYNRKKFELIEIHRTSLRYLIDPTLSRVCARATTQGDVKSPDEEPPATDPAVIKSLLEEHPILKDIESENAKKCLSCFDDIRERIFSSEPLLKRYLVRQTILQTSLLRCRGSDDNYILLANTHLYFAPDADHIRLLQGSVCYRYIEFIKDYYRNILQSNHVNAKSNIHVVFCGDMNSVPECGLYKLLTEGEVPEDFPDWSSNEEERVTNLSVKAELRFRSAYENLPYTNYIPTFSGCLDYIYYEVDGLNCDSVVPLPDHEDVVATGGIPNDVIPSDHLALVANLSFKSL